MDAAAAERPGILEALGWSGRDAVAFVVALAAAILIFVNTLFLQPGPHPAPMVRSSVAAITPPKPAPNPTPNPTQGQRLASTSAHLPSPRPPEAPKAEPAKAAPAPTTTSTVPAAPAAPARPNTAVVADIQRELSRRGFYDGVVDGRYG